eukprot:CAMPEP_0116136234 /NCGR_PEP_ID=MMETSP0329-20121206/11614_1 /TAXON_ID=697910 /ORGANISM="Pseudo-nitzschia arenysensis, Strain B593" /LENGTH=648 /DNA_ID=CAMNT_0003631085 /DNA_START=94 /DNA_END=2040 /DNA_ORIENTATION=-
MAAAFLMEQGRRRTSAEFMREIEEDGIKFNIENTAEDIVNGLFCTYEPPTSKVQQYKAASAVRKDPTKYNVRPSVPKSILKFKIKKNKKPQPMSTAFVTPVIEPVAPAVALSEARDDAVEDVSVEDKDSTKKSVTWRDQKGKEERTDLENKVVGLASKYCGGAFNTGEAIADVLSSPTGRATQNFFSTDVETPGSMASMASSLFDRTEDGDKKVLYDDLGNPIREADIQDDENGSYFPSTPKDTATPTPMAKTRAEKLKEGGHSNLFCSNIPFMDTMVEGIGIAGVMAASAAVAAGVPENLCSPYVKSKNPNSTADDDLDEALGIYEPDSYDQLTSAVKLSRQSTPRYFPGSNAAGDKPDDEERDAPPQQDATTPKSFAPSDITMGNTTINHFSGNASLFDEKRGAPSPKKNFSSMLGELKKIQVDKGLQGSSQHENEDRSVAGGSVAGGSVAGSVNSLKKGFIKSPRSPVVTRTYMESIKSPRSPGKVADLAKKFESPRAARKPIEPVECRQFNGMMNFLPPTPRRKSPEAQVTSTESIKPVSKSIEMFERNIKETKKETASTPPAESVNTDAEIRATASSVVDVTAQRGGRNDAEATNTDANEEREKSSSDKKKAKKNKKGGFGKTLKKVMKITKKVESQRIAKED